LRQPGDLLDLNVFGAAHFSHNAADLLGLSFERFEVVAEFLDRHVRRKNLFDLPEENSRIGHSPLVLGYYCPRH
jgi:hypothetical protein